MEKNIIIFLVLLWCIAVSWQDWKTRKISNSLTIGAILVTSVFRFGYGGLPMFLDGFAAGFIAGLFLFIPFLLRSAGGGDVKMLFAAGAIVGWSGLLSLLWITSLAGFILAVLMMFVGAVNTKRLKHFMQCVFNPNYDKKIGRANLPSKNDKMSKVPFSIPISVGLLITLGLGKL